MLLASSELEAKDAAKHHTMPRTATLAKSHLVPKSAVLPYPHPTDVSCSGNAFLMLHPFLYVPTAPGFSVGWHCNCLTYTWMSDTRPGLARSTNAILL